MAVTLPEGDLSSRLERYLDGFKNRHGLEEANQVRLRISKIAGQDRGTEAGPGRHELIDHAVGAVDDRGV